MISNANKLEMFKSICETDAIACFDNNSHLITFVVKFGDLETALGKNSANAAKLKLALGKNVRIIEYNKSALEFVRNVCLPIKLTKVYVPIDKKGLIVAYVKKFEDRGRLIGRQAAILRNNESIVNYFFPEILEVRIEHLLEDDE